MSEWQPIATAPKDTAVLLYNLGYVVGHFNTAYGRWIAYGHDDSSARAFTQWPPTHWMPLPEAPIAKGREARKPAAVPTVSDGETKEP